MFKTEEIPKRIHSILYKRIIVWEIITGHNHLWKKRQGIETGKWRKYFRQLRHWDCIESCCRGTERKLWQLHKLLIAHYAPARPAATHQYSLKAQLAECIALRGGAVLKRNITKMSFVKISPKTVWSGLALAPRGAAALRQSRPLADRARSLAALLRTNFVRRGRSKRDVFYCAGRWLAVKCCELLRFGSSNYWSVNILGIY